ncbi:hypothetical protein SmJEL517_g00008 [Synchytrium microbalum]|uniref:EGF-like domain-containing protein n=1 Tax=Synchytrium microbalum TaxID=1806994 RepID=A0A507CJK9_9FUNG|nr:uncharacterized protein SmJEL517_g00008 [Synchytrium microbalum]TPX38005.1 hypothetical protein SmJEL517_g00008 [Synchytrium microbalum]
MNGLIPWILVLLCLSSTCRADIATLFTSQNQSTTIGFNISVTLLPQPAMIYSANIAQNYFAVVYPSSTSLGVVLRGYSAALSISARKVRVERDGCTSPVCSAHGLCNDNLNCQCDDGWTGPSCDRCDAGFYGANCTGVCNCPSGAGCNNGMYGDGTCKCKGGFLDFPYCTQCPVQGFWGPDCTPCNCSHQYGSCDPNTGSCKCAAGYDVNATPRCSKCQPGFYQTYNPNVGLNDCVRCFTGCAQCTDPDATCTLCSPGLHIDPTDHRKCIPDRTCSGFANYWNGSTCQHCPNGCSCVDTLMCSSCDIPNVYPVVNECGDDFLDEYMSCHTADTLQYDNYWVNMAKAACDSCMSGCATCGLPRGYVYPPDSASQRAATKSSVPMVVLTRTGLVCRANASLIVPHVLDPVTNNALLVLHRGKWLDPMEPVWIRVLMDSIRRQTRRVMSSVTPATPAPAWIVPLTIVGYTTLGAGILGACAFGFTRFYFRAKRAEAGQRQWFSAYMNAFKGGAAAAAPRRTSVRRKSSLGKGAKMVVDVYEEIQEDINQTAVCSPNVPAGVVVGNGYPMQNIARGGRAMPLRPTIPDIPFPAPRPVHLVEEEWKRDPTNPFAPMNQQLTNYPFI